ncbi:biotin/lipoyl-containing protein, partial [Comamonas thiooxydans]
AQQGGSPSPHYDTLLAKLVVHSNAPHFEDVLRRSRRALADCRIVGLATNLPLLQALAQRPEVLEQTVHTRWLEEVLPQLVEAAEKIASSASNSKNSDTFYSENKADKAQQAPENAVLAPMPAMVVQWSVAVGETVARGAELGILEAMKMQHVLFAQAAGRVQALLAEAGSYVAQDQALLVLAPVQGEAAH